MADLNLGDTQKILKACKAHKASLKEASYILATAYWETAKTMKPVREAFWLSEAWRKTHLRYFPYYGRGYVQITWEANYKFAGNQLGLDLTTDPDKVMEPEIAAEILVRGSLEGWFTGKKLSDFTDYKSMRRVINGADKASEIAEIAEDYEKTLLSSGYALEDSKADFLSALIKVLTELFKRK